VGVVQSIGIFHHRPFLGLEARTTVTGIALVESGPRVEPEGGMVGAVKSRI
jgi:hypothetical protein